MLNSIIFTALTSLFFFLGKITWFLAIEKNCVGSRKFKECIYNVYSKRMKTCLRPRFQTHFRRRLNKKRTHIYTKAQLECKNAYVHSSIYGFTQFDAMHRNNRKREKKRKRRRRIKKNMMKIFNRSWQSDKIGAQVKIFPFEIWISLDNPKEFLDFDWMDHEARRQTYSRIFCSIFSL